MANTPDASTVQLPSVIAPDLILDLSSKLKHHSYLLRSRYTSARAGWSPLDLMPKPPIFARCRAVMCQLRQIEQEVMHGNRPKKKSYCLLK